MPEMSLTIYLNTDRMSYDCQETLYQVVATDVIAHGGKSVRGLRERPAAGKTNKEGRTIM
jgi:hypothetical protein